MEKNVEAETRFALNFYDAKYTATNNKVIIDYNKEQTAFGVNYKRPKFFSGIYDEKDAMIVFTKDILYYEGVFPSKHEINWPYRRINYNGPIYYSKLFD